jgi:phosphodiesterase/alkaline phosphatase D-like protein
LVRGPYLQSGSTTSVVVRWRTDWLAESRVACGTNPANLGTVLLDEDETTEHEMKLTGLRPDTKYYYAVGTLELTLAGGLDHFFVTAPLAAKPTRLWVIGDAGTVDANQRAVRDAYYAAVRDDMPERHTDLWLMLGDNAYEIGSDTEYQDAVFDTTFQRETMALNAGLGREEDGGGGGNGGPYRKPAGGLGAGRGAVSGLLTQWKIGGPAAARCA